MPVTTTNFPKSAIGHATPLLGARILDFASAFLEFVILTPDLALDSRMSLQFSRIKAEEDNAGWNVTCALAF